MANLKWFLLTVAFFAWCGLIPWHNPESSIASLAVALTLGVFICLPQVIPALQYYPKSIRQGQSSHEKSTIGCVSLRMLLHGLLNPSSIQSKGVFSPEYTASVGLVGLFLAILGASAWQWMALTVLLCLASGGYLFNLLSPFMLRIPARWMYFVGVVLVFCAVRGAILVPPHILKGLVLLQALNLLIIHPRLWPMFPFVQRVEKPFVAFGKWSDTLPLPCRISGLPYPGRTGQIHHQMTLGYSAGSQLKAMANFREETDPNGSDKHDGIGLSRNKLNWFGVMWVYSYRPLDKLGFLKTSMPHIWRNPDCTQFPSWTDLEAAYGEGV